jgi:thiamine pyrophosphokinase
MENKLTPSRKREFCFYMNTVIFANGVVDDPELLSPLLKTNEFLIAADGGLRHIRELQLKPDLVIGDLDSVTEEDQKWILENQIETRKFPKKKDQTDLELALLAAIDLGGDPITVVGALGGRIDQTLTNIYLLLMPELQNADIRFEDGHEELFLIQRHAEILGKKGDTVSLLPLLSPATGIKTKGLKYPLHDEILFPERSRGVSNEMESGKTEVTLKSGILLCIHTHKLIRNKK